MGQSAQNAASPTQRFDPRSDIGGQQIAHAAVDFVKLARGFGKGPGLAVQRLRANRRHCIAQQFLVPRSPDKTIGIKRGKRLPLTFEHGNHLPQVCRQRHGHGGRCGTVGRDKGFSHRFSSVRAATG